MTLADLVDRCRSSLTDETVQVRRSWEEMFTYTLRHYSADTPIEQFDPGVLCARLTASGMSRPVADGYAKRWRAVLAEPNGPNA